MGKGVKSPSWIQKPVMGETYKIDEFCFCLGTIKSGTLFIGVIYTILSVLAVAVNFSYTPYFEVKFPEAVHGQYTHEFGLYGIYTLITLTKVTSILWLIVNLALLYGTIEERAEFVAPWIGWHLVLFFLEVIVAVWCGDIITNYIKAHAADIAGLIIILLISEGLLIYFFIVVNSFHQALKKREQENRTVKPTTSI